MELKFVPNGDKLEMRVRGVSVFPGYRDAPQLTAQAFDEEGYYRIGDAGLLADPSRPERGVVFNGRVAEDFKLDHRHLGVGRHAARARGVRAGAAGAGRGHHRPRPRRGRRARVPDRRRPRSCAPKSWRTACARRCGRLRADGGGSSQRPTRALLLTEPPSADAGEITDKGYINQRAVLRAPRRATCRRCMPAATGVILPDLRGRPT